jgi:putative ABC transport system permease protein
LSNYTGVDKAVRLVRGFGNNWLEIDPNHDINIPISGFFADPEILDVFQYELEFGDPRTALIEPYSVVLTKQAAEKLFRNENPVGESIKVGKLGVYKVTGVIKKTENRSHITADAFASIATVRSLKSAKVVNTDLDDWYNYTSGWVYILLQEGKTMEDINPVLAKISKDHFSNLPPEETVEATYSSQNLLEIVPGRMINNPIGPFMPWFLIYFLAGIAGIILITSCFNFTNLSIARSLNRAREIGVRKVTGAARSQIFFQFISEAIVISLFALIVAIGLIYALRPFIVDLAFARFLKWNLSANYLVYAIFIALAVIVGIVAGLFPAVVLSGFQPVKVLKNLGNTRMMSKVGLRKALLVVQFSLSMIFILTDIVLYNQLNLFLHNDNGFSVENKVILHKGNTSLESLKTELEKRSNILSVSATSHVPMVGISHGSGFKKTLDEKDWKFLNYYSVDEDYIQNMGLTLQVGKFFSEEAGLSNKDFIILNEEAVKFYHFENTLDAIGKSLIIQDDSSHRQVIGVVKDYQHELFGERLEPMALIYDPEKYSILQVEYNGDFAHASKTIEQTWARINPGVKLDMRLFEDELGRMYEIVFGTLVKVLGFISFLAITISCLGLLGMATYTIETRKKEIAVRKILGSSNKALVYILSKGYVSILLLSLVIALPVAYYLNMFWLENLANHVSIDIVTVASGVLVLAFFGLFTIASQTIQATFLNPVDNLKND